MKIILLKDVKKQGKKGNILNVKDGYGTFLINKGDAVLATTNSVNRLDRENSENQKNRRWDRGSWRSSVHCRAECNAAHQ